MKNHIVSFLRLCFLFVLITGAVFQPQYSVYAATTLTATPLTWNVIGLDSNNVSVGPNHFPVGARVCNTGSAVATNVRASFVWDSTNSNINLRPGTAGSGTAGAPADLPPSGTINLAIGACTDFYFEVEVTRNSAAYDTTRQYHIAITADAGTTTASTPTPRELYVEHLISQARNIVNGIELNGAPVAPGGTMTLMVGQTYDITIHGATATQGYNQLEEFINFPNTIFQVVSVTTSYSADNTTPVVPAPLQNTTMLYGDACVWENNPNSPNYRACIGGDDKNGGTVDITYSIRILQVPGAPLVNPEPLSTLIYDFSGSSFHYNADYDVSTRYANIVNASIIKSFAPKVINPNGTSTLTFTINNPGPAALTGVNFTDTLPGGVTLAANATTPQCGGGTVTGTSGGNSISLTNGIVAAYSTCTVTATVTASTDGTYNNTSGHLFINTSIDTGSFATDTLIVTSNPPAPSTCPGSEVTLASWSFPAAGQGSGGGATTPDYTTKQTNVATATALYTPGASGTPTINTAEGSPAVNSWRGEGGWASTNTGFPSATTGPYFTFSVDTSNYGGVRISYNYALLANGDWANPGNNFVYTYSSADGAAYSNLSTISASKGNWFPSGNINAASTGANTTAFRINAVGANKTTSAVHTDEVIIQGCARPVVPTLAKAFVPPTIAQGNASTLTFIFTNPNTTALSAISFSDTLPTGLVINTPNGLSAISCTTGSVVTAPTITATQGTSLISMSGLQLAANSSCSFSVSVNGNVAGAYTNTSGNITSTSTGPNTTSAGYGVSSLTVVAPPVINKAFTANPIFTGNSTALTFAINNPNTVTTLTGVNFTDNLPAGLIVATPNGLSGSCGGGTITAAPGFGVISLTGASLAAGATCTFSVNVTGTTVGLKTNSVTVASINGGTTGVPSTADVLVKTPAPAINLLKQVSSTSSGPWTPYLTVTTGSNVFYRFIVENTGDVALTNVSVSDPTVSTLGCAWTRGDSATSVTSPFTLLIADASNNQIATCVLGPIIAVSGSHTNTATATFSGATPSDESSSSATYATLTVDKDTSTPAIAPNGIVVYTIVVVNSGDMDLTNFQVTDTLPDFNGASAGKGYSVTSVTAPGYTVNGAFDGSINISLLAGTDMLADNTTATITITLTLSNATPGTYDNTVTAFTDETDSVGDDGLAADDPGTPGSGADPETDEDVAVFEASPTKSIVTTSEQSTGFVFPTERVAIGEIVRYRLATLIPQGSFTNVRLVDGIPNGLQFLDDNTATVAFVCNGGAGCMTSSTLSGAGLVVSGSSSAVSPTFVVPGAAIIGGPFTSGTNVTFSFGNITNSDADADSEYIVVEFNALVLNVNTSPDINQGVDNSPGSSGGSNGNFRPNDVTLTINGSQVGSTSPNVTVSIAEPAITVITKSVAPVASSYLPGDALTYTLLFSNVANGGSASTAFDIVLTDTFNANLTLGTVTITSSQGTSGVDTCAGGTTFTAGSSTTLQTVTVNISCLDPSETVTVTVAATISAGTTSGTTISNSAGLTYTSLPGVQGNCATVPFSCAGVGGTGSGTGERNGSGGLGADGTTLNNYAVTSNTVNSTVAFGSITITKDAVPNDAQNFAFTGTGPSGFTFGGGFSLDDDADVTLPNTQTFTPLIAGSYTVTEGFVAGWTLTGLTCPDPDTGSTVDLGTATASIDLDAGESITCTYINTGAQANLAITKTDGVTSINAGGTTTYTIVVTNNGPSAANNAVFTDPPVVGLNVTNVTCGSATGGAACGVTSVALMQGAGIVIPTFPSGGSVTFTVTATVTAASGNVTNTATIDPPAGITDPNTNDNTVSDTDAVNNPSFTIVKDADVFDVDAAGDIITYTVTLTNTGNVMLTGVSVNDPLLANLDCDGVAGAPFTTTGLTIAVSGTLTCTGTYTVMQADIDNNGGGDGLINNTVTGDTNETGSQTSSEIVEIIQTPAIMLTKTPMLNDGVVAPSSVANVGDTITYTFNVQNTGNVTLTNITVSDPLLPTLTCTIASLAPGANANCTPTNNVYTLTQADINAGARANTATAQADCPVGPNPCVTDPDTQNTPLPAAPSMTLTKTPTLNTNVVAPNGVANAGDTITYTFNVQNTGNVTLTNVVVTDPLLPTLTCTIASLAPGANANCTPTNNVYTLTQVDVNAGAVSNTATAVGDCPVGPNPCTTDPDTQNTPLPAAPSMTLTKTPTLNTNVVAPNGVANVGDTITYTFNVQNTGNVTLTNVVVTDPLLPTLTCTIASLAPGANANCTPSNNVYTLTQADINAGARANTATAVGDCPVGPNPCATDPDTRNTPLPAVGSMTLTKTATLDMTVVAPNGVANAGDTITYTFNVQNTGNVTLTNITVSDPLLPTLTCTIASLAPGANANCTPTNNVYTLTQADIDAGARANTATAQGDCPVGPNPCTTDTDTRNTPWLASPSMILTKTATLNTNVVAPNGVANVGDTITYTFNVQNTGNVTLTNIVVTDPLLPTLTCTLASLAPGANANCTPTNNVYTLTQADINAGARANTATAQADCPVGPNPCTTDPDTQNTPLPASPSIVLTKTPALDLTVVAPNGVANVGDTITYTFNVQNTGNVTLTNITVSDPLLPTLTCTIASLASGANANCTPTNNVYTLTQADINAGARANTATAQADCPVGPNPCTTDPDTQNTPLPASPSIVLTKTPALDLTVVAPNGVANVGDTITYTFNVQNTGNVTLTNITVSDPLLPTLTCTIASLAPGANANCAPTNNVYTLTQADINAGARANTATAQGDCPVGPNPCATDPDTQNTPLPASPSIVLTKTPALDLTVVAPNGVANVGDTITYTFNVQNTGNVTLTNIVVTDPLLPTLTCTIASLAPGANANCTPTNNVYTLTQADINAGAVSNTATAVGDCPVGPNPCATDPDTQNTPLPASPSMTLTKTPTLNTNVVAPNGVANVGDTITYTFNIQNTGNVTLTNIVVTDPLLPTLTCTIASLAPGANANCTPTNNMYTLTQADINAGARANTATAQADCPVGPNPCATDPDTQNTPLPAAPAIQLLKTGTLNDNDGTPGLTAGDTISYAFTVTNTGNVTLSNITLTDTVGGVTISGGPIASLTPGASDTTTFTGTYIVTQNDINAGSFTNTATVTGDCPGPVAGCATDPDTYIQILTGVPTADLSITKTDGVTTYIPGGSTTYTITASNAGPNAVTGATVADTVPASITATWTCVGAGGGTCTASGSGNINDSVNLPAGGSVTYTVSVSISASATGSLTNTATVAVPAGTTDPTPGNNSATDTDNANPQADLSVTKTDGVTTYTAGTSTTYTIVVNNAGPSNVTGATFADTFPAAITSATWTCVGAGGGTCTASGSGNINDSVNLPAGGSVTYTVTADINASATGSLTNTATIAVPAGTTDPNPGNNSATDTDTDNPQADLSVTKTDGVTTYTPGTSTTYTIVVSNAGPSAVTGATFADTFPVAITSATWTCVGSGGGTCTASGSGNISDNVDLPVGGSVTYTVTATISAAATGNLINTATIAAPAGVTDPTPGNNSASDTDSATPPASISGVVYNDADLNGTKSGSEPGIVGVIINLYDSTDTTLIATTTTGPAGTYSFTNLPPGSYTVVEIDPAGYVSSTPNSVPVTVASGATGTANFGDYQLPNTALSNISGVVFNDANGNGVQDAGETPLSGVTVELENNLGIVIATATTNASGAYTFTNLPAGTYTVVETDLPGYVSTTLNNIAVTLSAGTNATVNFGDQTVVGNPLIADPAVTKLGTPSSAVVGDVVVYTITVGNNGNTNATNVVLTDTKPAFLDIISISISPNPGLTPVISGNTFTINFGTVAPTDFYTITVITRVNAQGVPPGGVNNAAITTSSGTDRTFNNASAAQLIIASRGGGNPSTVAAVTALPNTGFAPNVVTSLPVQPSNMLYAATDLLLEIPSLGVKMPIVGISKKNGAWDVTWLGKQAGWLEGTAFPSWSGNSVLTGHVYDANGLPGPFVNLGKLKYGDKIIVHAYGQKYTFEVRTNQTVAPDDTSALKHEEKSWLTLVTCKEYDEKTNTYKKRAIVRAVLVSVDWDK